VVFDVPTVARTSDCNIRAHINDTTTLQCQFNASTVEDVTIVVWMKGDIVINSSDHYKIKSFTKPAIEDLIISELIISNITTADQGKYSCYCYYNRELVITNKPVISEQRSFTVYLYLKNCSGGIYVYYIANIIIFLNFFSGQRLSLEYVVITIVVSLLLILSVLAIFYYKSRRCLCTRIPGKGVSMSCDSSISKR